MADVDVTRREDNAQRMATSPQPAHRTSPWPMGALQAAAVMEGDQKNQKNQGCASRKK
jgi:hypothetical protein